VGTKALTSWPSLAIESKTQVEDIFIETSKSTCTLIRRQFMRWWKITGMYHGRHVNMISVGHDLMSVPFLHTGGMCNMKS
jgi:hypothetical protein